MVSVLYHGPLCSMISQNLYRKGFTLIDLVVVAAVIAIIAALTLPRHLELRIRANQHYAMQHLLDLQGTSEVVQGWERSRAGYNYSLTPPNSVESAEFQAVAWPMHNGKSGRHCYRITKEGVLEYRRCAPKHGDTPEVDPSDLWTHNKGWNVVSLIPPVDGH